MGMLLGGMSNKKQERVGENKTGQSKRMKSKEYSVHLTPGYLLGS